MLVKSKIIRLKSPGTFAARALFKTKCKLLADGVAWCSYQLDLLEHTRSSALWFRYRCFGTGKDEHKSKFSSPVADWSRGPQPSDSYDSYDGLHTIGTT